MSKDVRKQMSQQAFFDFFNQFGSTPDNYTTIVLEELFKKLYETLPISSKTRQEGNSSSQRH